MFQHFYYSVLYTEDILSILLFSRAERIRIQINHATGIFNSRISAACRTFEKLIFFARAASLSH